MAKTVRRAADLGELSAAEQQVLDGLDSGEVILVGDGRLPQAGDEARRVRAALLRLLLLADDPGHLPHEKGLRIAGAWVPDLLDLEGCRIPRDIAMFCFRFDVAPTLVSASIESLFLSGSFLPGLEGDRLEARGDVSLREVEATGEVRLVGALVGGNVSCTGATFRAVRAANGNPGHSFNADRLKAGANVLLDNVQATGVVRLAAAVLGADLACDGARFQAEKGGDGKPGNAFYASGLGSGLIARR